MKAVLRFSEPALSKISRRELTGPYIDAEKVGDYLIVTARDSRGAAVNRQIWVLDSRVIELDITDEQERQA